jgi:SagB-type dehydrogenase family enzyme
VARSTSDGSASVRYRRSPYLVSYWQRGRLILHQYVRGARLEATPAVLEILDGFEGWRTLAQAGPVVSRLEPLLAARLVRALVRHGLLDVEGAPVPEAEVAAAGWHAWNPAAGFYHGATRDVAYWSREAANEVLRVKAARTPPPRSTPRATIESRGPVIQLARPRVDGDLGAVLRERRTWRRFGRGTIETGKLATLLGLTWGVQAWVTVDGYGSMPLKTAPSGGARHGIEAHVVARGISGTPGRSLFRYDAAGHALVARGSVSRAEVGRWFPHQAWIARVPFLVVMTAVFARPQWRYPSARAYRTVLAEAGHHAQTFCLLATALGLAPFCTMAFADSIVERAIGVDGFAEAAIYVVGAGTRPRATRWAPWPHTTRVPARRDVDVGRVQASTEDG